jgi:hypothetical protein
MWQFVGVLNKKTPEEKIQDIKGSISEIKYKDWELKLSYKNVKGKFKDIWLQWIFSAPCVKTGETIKQKSRKWRLSIHMTRTEVINTAFSAALMASEHELRENFKYKEQPVFCGHISVDDRAYLLSQKYYKFDERT